MLAIHLCVDIKHLSYTSLLIYNILAINLYADIKHLSYTSLC